MYESIVGLTFDKFSLLFDLLVDTQVSLFLLFELQQPIRATCQHETVRASAASATEMDR